MTQTEPMNLSDHWLRSKKIRETKKSFREVTMIRTYDIEIQGLTPLLMHWDNIQWADEMEEWLAIPENKANSKAGDDRTPAYKWIGSVYNDGEFVCVPSDNLSRAFMDAGAMVPNKKKTFKSQTQSGMKIDQLLIPLAVKDSFIDWKPIQNLPSLNLKFTEHLTFAQKHGFDLSVKRAKIGTSKHIRVRPKFDNWALQFSVSVWDEQITEEILTRIVDRAGNYRGLGDWRPGSKTPGSWGMFKRNKLKLSAKAA